MEPIAVATSVGKGAGPVARAIQFLVAHFRTLDAEMRGIAFRDVSGSRDIFVVITPYPIAFLAEVQIANGSQMRLGVRKVTLEVSGQKFDWVERELPAFEPGDVRLVDFTFPADAAAPKSGPYVLTILDSRGKSKILKGQI